MAVSQLIIGGTEVYSNVSLLNTPIQIKDTGGSVHGWYIDNDSSTKRFVKIWDTLAAPDPAVDIPKLTLGIPKKQAANVFGLGLRFANGLWISCTTGRASTNTTAPSADEVLVNIFYT